jgi:hypothetical protein
MSTRSYLRHLVLVLALLFGLTAAIVSVIPIDRIALGTRPRRGANRVEVLRAGRLHASAHIVLFSALSVAAWFAAGFAAKVREVAATKLIALMLLLLLGWGTEYLQHLFYRNKLERNDVFYNLLTSVSAFAILALVEQIRKRSPEPKPGGELITHALTTGGEPPKP